MSHAAKSSTAPSVAKLSRRTTRRGSAGCVETPIFPAPLDNGKKLNTFTLKDVPDKVALAKVLKAHGLDTADWGQGDTKDVGKYWKEIQLDEAGLEVWQTKSGETKVVRVTHVLRAKVCSEASFENNVFLFNTWQQYGDGRKRIRNGLLSEKLCVAEMPLEDNLHAVCERAVTEEEMQRVVPSSTRITANSPAPEYDAKIPCPLKVTHEIFVDHTIEIEVSKSYPGLLTMYHLYTVDIICSGLPTVDFNTLEFDHPDEQGHRKLKYIHAWVWLDWSQIQRFLFEGSEMKERKTKGSFANAAAMRDWLSHFDIELDSWGRGHCRSVNNLFDEVERDETQLELWGRHDGVPLLMRVVHILQLVVYADDDQMQGLNSRHLMQTWQQSPSGEVKTVHRIMAKKLSTSMLPFDEARFKKVADEAVRSQLSFLVDPASMRNDPPPCSKEDAMSAKLSIKRTSSSSGNFTVGCMKFVDQRYDIEESPSYKGMHTMYHLYTVQVAVKGLPQQDFTSLDFDRAETFGKDKPYQFGWKWVTWMEAMDLVHGKASSYERRDVERTKQVAQSAACFSKLKAKVNKVAGDDQEATTLLGELDDHLKEMQAQSATHDSSLSSMLPPSMISKLSEAAANAFEAGQTTNRNYFDRTATTQANLEGFVTLSTEEDEGKLVMTTLQDEMDDSQMGKYAWCGCNPKRPESSKQGGCFSGSCTMTL